ncbi:MAG: aldo/keto reductase [Defluviitaleaceae bacterium]|nr:aldo/keto reductase [Defluviitaleaceae bacterium]
MKTIDLGKSGMIAPVIAFGCMRMRDMDAKDAARAVQTAMDNGINFFDHADVYGAHGRAEEVFAAAVIELGMAREDMIIQTKCGIVRSVDQKSTIAFDFSKEYIISATEGSLRRLGTDYIDILLLHRPDTLVEPEEVAAAFDNLHSRGLVRHFGVSNQSPAKMRLLQKYTKHRLIVNQLQFSIVNTGMVDFGFNMNMKNAASVDHDGGVLEYCRLEDITIQAWSPFRLLDWSGVFIDHPDYPELNAVLARLAEKYNVSKDAIAAAWILRHPANMQIIIGSMNPARIADVACAVDVMITREEWYEVYMAVGNRLP